MADADELASVRKELQSVKTRAVGKIKALQAEVDQLKAALAERPPTGPPDEPASDGSEVSNSSGFVKVGDGDAQMRARAAELQRREEELAQREADLLQREAALAAQHGVGGAVPQWHAALLAGLAEVKSNALQAQLAAESCGVAK